MKHPILVFLFFLTTLSIVAQRIVFPGQNQIYRFLEDPSFISNNKEYNITGLLQFSDSDISNSSQYVFAQLAFFDNVAFGIDYSRHNFDDMRYSQFYVSNRVRFELGDFYKYINLGVSLGTDRVNEINASTDNEFVFIYRFAASYRNYNLTIGGFYNHYPFQSDISIGNTADISSTKGYSVYASYDFAINDDLRFTPFIRYNSYENFSFIEGVALLGYKGKSELAFSYKNDYSVNAVASAKFFKRLKLSYSYEKALSNQNFGAIHAVGISVDLAAKATDIPEWLANVKRDRIKINNQKNKYKKDEVVDSNTKIATEEKENTKVAEVSKELTEEERLLIEHPPMSEDDPDDMVDNHLKPGYYIILGSFKNVENANREVERLREEGFYARVGNKDANDDFNYVYVDRYQEEGIAAKRASSKRKEAGFEDVWVMRVK